MVTDTDPGSERSPRPAKAGRPQPATAWFDRPWVLVIQALACWIAPLAIAGFLDPEEPSGEVYITLLVAAWIFVLFPLGCVLMVAAWRIRRRTGQRGSVEEPAGRPRRRVEGGCLSSAVPLAAIGLLTVFLWANITRDWRPALLAASPSVAAVAVAVRDHRAARRSGAPRPWDLLALVIGTVTLAWCVAVILGARWPSGWDYP